MTQLVEKLDRLFFSLQESSDSKIGIVVYEENFLKGLLQRR